MKRLSLLFLICLPLIVAGGRDIEMNSLMDSASGYIDITVESNVNRLFFKYDLNEGCLTLSDRIRTAFVNDTAFQIIRIPVKEFRSTNQLAYRDFLELVRAEEYPFLEITIPEKPVPLDQTRELLVLNGVSLTFTGVTRYYDVRSRIEVLNAETNRRLLTGIIRIKLTDFDIDPPVKWAGLVRVRDEIIVKFGFCVKDVIKVPLKI